MRISTGNAETLFAGLEKAARKAGIPVTVNRMGSMGCLFFASETVTDFESAQRGNQALFRKYYREMLDRGIYLAPSPFETTFPLHGPYGGNDRRNRSSC